MNNRLVWLAALAVAGAAAGCSDSTDDFVQPGYDDLTDQFDAVLDSSSDLPLTDGSALPVSGSATYDGVMVMSTDGSDDLPSDMAGQMTLRADFGDDAMSGSVDHVVTSGDDFLEGSLDISNGEIDRDADPEDFYAYSFEVNGTLTEDDGTDLEVDAIGAGDFLGDDYQRAQGRLVDGVVSSDRGASLLGGGFIGTR